MSEAPEHEIFVDEVDLAKKRKQRWRLGALGVFVVTSLVLVHATGLSQRIDVEAVRDFVEASGWWGLFAYWLAYSVGVLVHLPGAAFVGAASLAYGHALGMLIGYVGAMGASLSSFVLVRAVGGQPLGQIQKPWVRKIFARLDSHPITTVAILRALFFSASWLNYACAMSSLRLREYLIGSAIGLIPQAVGYSLLFDWLAERFL